jgi:hypothetical protein
MILFLARGNEITVCSSSSSIDDEAAEKVDDTEEADDAFADEAASHNALARSL